MDNEYTSRHATAAQDADKLQKFFNAVFHPEDVGGLAKIIFEHFPGMEKRYWFIIEDEPVDEIIAAFALIPWELAFEGTPLKVAEMGIVGTHANYRGRGLQRILNEEFNRTLIEEGYDLAIIQGIPGFYDQFGFRFSIPLENHINLPLHIIVGSSEGYAFRLATPDDIPFLMQEDERYRATYAFSAMRSEAKWRYLLTESLKTEYGSEFWIVEGDATARGEKFYCRIPAQGFGEGLIVSEISEGSSPAALQALFGFCKEKAKEREKPYVRLNVHNESDAGRLAISMGAKEGSAWAWQVKFPAVARFIKSAAPIFEKRIAASTFAGYSGVFRLDLYKEKVDLVWDAGTLKEVRKGSGDADLTFMCSSELFPLMALGHRTWQELRHIRPDTFPASAESEAFVETLFEKKPAWIHEQY